MSTGGTDSPLFNNKKQHSSVISLFTLSGDAQMTGEYMKRTSPQAFRMNPSSYLHTSDGSSPSDSPLVGLSPLPADALQSHNVFDQEFELGITQQQLTGEMLDMHSLQSSSTPPLPDYKSLPPLSPRTILATLDDIANTGPKKKSHARKQPAGHIPRPRNAFILFRCLFVSQQSVPVSVEKDHRNISRIAGRVWKAMSEEEREPWIKAADIEKARHEQRWPGYRYNPVQTNPTQVKRSLNSNIIPNATRVQSAAAGSSRMENNVSERPGRSLIRSQGVGVHRVFKQPELPVQYLSPQNSTNSQFPLHAPLPRMASVSPTAGAVSDLHNARHLESLSMQSIHFSDPFQSRESPTSANDGYGNISTPPSAYSFEGSLPPDSPAVTSAPPTNFARIPPRRSSSCPPLPPPGSFGFAYYSNPIMLQSPSNQYSPTPLPLVDSEMDGLFRNPFPSNSIFASVPPFAGANNAPHIPSNQSLLLDEHHRSVIIPDSLALPQRHIPAHLDTNSRLMHRRGSSLDRALASSALAGVFGGFSRNSQHWINPWTEPPHINSVVQRSQPISLPEPQLVVNTNHYNPVQHIDTSLSSSGTETPGLSPSPQSSFEHVDVYQNRPPQDELYNLPKEPYCRTSTPKSVGVSAQSPVDENFKHPGRKVSGRLFGSQGARLGLDLDLESPLSLDISFKEGRGLMDSHLMTQNLNHSTASSTGPDSPSFPYTPASASGLSPSAFTYSYTQALLDPEMDLASQEFHLSPDK